MTHELTTRLSVANVMDEHAWNHAVWSHVQALQARAGPVDAVVVVYVEPDNPDTPVMIRTWSAFDTRYPLARILRGIGRAARRRLTTGGSVL